MKCVSSLIISFAIGLSATALTAAPDNIRTYGKAVSIGVVPNLALSPIQKTGLRQFRKQNAYFGAMYVSGDGTNYQHFVNWHSLDRVKDAARKGCELISNDTCTLAAVSVPKDVDPNGTNPRGLGSWGNYDLADYHARQVTGGYGAFAVSGSAHQGYSHDWMNEAEARAAAIAFCKIGVARDMAPLGIEGRAFARTKGYDTCRVIHVTQP